MRVTKNGLVIIACSHKPIENSTTGMVRLSKKEMEDIDDEDDGR